MIFLLLILCPSKMTSCLFGFGCWFFVLFFILYFFFKYFQAVTGTIKLPRFFFFLFPKADRKVPSFTLVWRNCASPRLSPAWLQQEKFLMILYLNHCFVFPSSLLSAEFLFYWFYALHPPKPKPAKSSVFQNQYDWHNLLQSLIFTEGAMEEHSWAEQIRYMGTERPLPEAVFPPLVGASCFWTRLTSVPGGRGKVDWQSCSFTWNSVL